MTLKCCKTPDIILWVISNISHPKISLPNFAQLHLRTRRTRERRGGWRQREEGGAVRFYAPDERFSQKRVSRQIHGVHAGFNYLSFHTSELHERTNCSDPAETETRRRPDGTCWCAKRVFLLFIQHQQIVSFCFMAVNWKPAGWVFPKYWRCAGILTCLHRPWSGLSKKDTIRQFQWD